MAKQKSNDGFHVDLEGIELSDASKNRIQAGIQKVIMNELAGYTPNPEGDEKPHHHFGGGVIVVPPKWWWGFIVRNLRPNEINNFTELNDRINQQTYGH